MTALVYFHGNRRLTNLKKRFFETIISISAIVLLFSITTVAASDIRILVLPFDIHTSGDMSFLQKGIQEMLNTRLTAMDGILAIDDDETRNQFQKLVDPISEPVAVSLGKSLKADFVVIGRVTLLGEQVSTDSRLLESSNGSVRLNFSRQGKTQGNILTHINQLASEIQEKLLGKAETPVAVQPFQSPNPAETAITAESHQHPEKLWKGIDQLSNDPIKTVTQDGKTAVSIWKSHRFDGETTSIAKGDIDGDQQDEIILILNNVVSVFRYQDGKVQKMAETGSNLDAYLFRVDAADINGNGRAEIFVNRLIQDKSRLKSIVYEWDGNQLVQVAELDRYLRVIQSESGDILMGQETGMGGLFATTIERMTWKNDTYSASAAIALPSRANIFSYSQGNALNDGRNVIAQITSDNYIKVIDPGGDAEWISPERFTGSAAWLPYPSDDSDGRKSDMPRKKRYFLPQRILISDIDRDGKNEILVIKNNDMTTYLFPNLRVFKNGHIECLIWDGMGMSPKWKTSDVPGHISDVMIADLNKDNRPEMVFSVVATQSTAFSRGESYLVFWAPN